MSTPSSGGTAPADVLARLQAVSDAALAHLSLDDLLDELLTRVRDALGTDTCAILLLDEPTNELVARAAKGIEEEVEQGVRIPVGRGFAGRIARERRPVVIADVDHSYVLNPILREKGIKSLLGAPLIAEGRILGVIHVGTLTHRRFEASEISLLEVVAQRVALAVDRALLYAQVVRVTEMQREFVALAAHELRTPAAAVYGLAATLKERSASLSTDVLEEVQQALYEQSERMRRLVEQLLDLSRLDTAQLRMEPVRVSLRRPIDEGVASATVGGARDDVHVDVPESLEVVVDPAAIERIVANLVANAFRYGAPPVTVTAMQTDHHVRIYVADRGEGVDPEFVPYLFDRFRRSDVSATKAPGTGLGLSIARAYAQAHGGDLFYSPEGAGARFELVVPAERVSV